MTTLDTLFHNNSHINLDYDFDANTIRDTRLPHASQAPSVMDRRRG
jgi:hypothetical protein